MEPKIINNHPHIPFHSKTISDEELETRSRQFYEQMDLRRSIREFSTRVVPQQVIENLVMTASTAPSGAHKQPWTFCLIQNPELKKQIREAAEKEEYDSYNGRMSDRWKQDLQKLATDWRKPFLEDAPWLIVVFKRVYEKDVLEKHNNYYVNESVGIACGFLIAAIHQAGLVTLTHTPSPMNFLTEILNRPDNERPFLLLPVGYAAEETYVPDLKRKKLEEVVEIY